MVFSSFVFLFFFLPVFIACYFLSPAKLKNAVILLFSYLFYAWGAPTIFPLFLLSCAIDFFIGLGLAGTRKKAVRVLLLAASLTVNLGALFYFKYSNFFAGEFNRLMAALGMEPFAWTAVVLPIGISFFTFHKISYIVDVYRGTVQPARNFINYALYIALFPQLVAGPIIRYYNIGAQIESRTHSLDDVLYGAYRFCIGLAKKVLLADAMGAVADNVFGLVPDALSSGYAWLGILCYAYQIYFDFSGYSDMAIGLGRMMGFRFLENFNMPYIAQSFTEFWRRWHISLSNWMRDYLYIPLGGNRVPAARAYANLWIVFLLSGLWHGASWTFVFWGMYHGLFLSLDKLFWLERAKRMPKAINIALTFLLVLIGWVFFRSETLSQALDYLVRMFDIYHFWNVPAHVPRALVIHNRGIFVFILATIISFLPASDALRGLFNRSCASLSETPVVLVRFAASYACLVLATLALATTNYSPFIYFRF